MKAVKIFFLIFLLVVGKNMQAQIIDTGNVTAVVENAEKDHSPKKAAWMSTALPGLGQAYNKKYWKIPIVYIGFGAIGYFVVWNNNNAKLMKTAWLDLTDKDPTTTSYLKVPGVNEDMDFSPGSSNYEMLKTALPKWQAYYSRNRDLLVICMVGFYALNVIDANVDAHLFNFDMSDNLTMNWQPSMFKINNELAYCINISFNF